MNPALISGINGVLNTLGPWGTLASLAVGVLGVGTAGHAVGKKKGLKKQKQLVDQGLVK